jgi:hypothetical protein
MGSSLPHWQAIPQPLVQATCVASEGQPASPMLILQFPRYPGLMDVALH